MKQITKDKFFIIETEIINNAKEHIDLLTKKIAVIKDGKLYKAYKKAYELISKRFPDYDIQTKVEWDPETGTKYLQITISFDCKSVKEASKIHDAIIHFIVIKNLGIVERGLLCDLLNIYTNPNFLEDK
jgi:hypothetical protein